MEPQDRSWLGGCMWGVCEYSWRPQFFHLKWNEVLKVYIVLLSLAIGVVSRPNLLSVETINTNLTLPGGDSPKLGSHVPMSPRSFSLPRLPPGVETPGDTTSPHVHAPHILNISCENFTTICSLKKLSAISKLFRILFHL